jgi:hypothetical protein
MIRPFFGLALRQALELRPRIALSSAEASNSVARPRCQAHERSRGARHKWRRSASFFFVA